MSFERINNSIFIKQGNTAGFDLKFNIDITGSTIYFTVKKELKDEIPLISKSITDHLDPVNGLTTINLTKEDTNRRIGKYLFDIQLVLTDGQVHTIFPKGARQLGELIITPTITPVRQ